MTADEKRMRSEIRSGLSLSRDDLPPNETSSGLQDYCDRQTEDWSEGIQTPIEHFILENPELVEDETLLLDLIYNEVLLREQHSQPASFDEYARRFPTVAASLRRMFEVHSAIESGTAMEQHLSADGHKGHPAVDAMPDSKTNRNLSPEFSVAATRPIAEEDTHPIIAPSDSAFVHPNLDGYHFVERIGRGGMGVVYRARQTGTDRDVAVKVFYAGLDASDEEIARFNIEAQASARLRHPSIVAVYEAGVREGVHFLAMEWIDGETLGQRLLERGPLAPRDAAELLETIARAVHYANQSGVIHRDLKPQNILLDRRGAPHVADFGLARFNDSNTTWTTGGRVLGTLHYMAPEQARGSQTEICPATDVYGLGAVLFQCLTGEPPYANRTAPQIIHDLLHRDPSLVGQLRKGIPADLEQICRKCLEKEPSSRYETAECFADDLRRFLQGQPVTARRLPWTAVTFRAIKRKPVVSGLAATTILLFLFVLIGAVLSAARFRRDGVELSRLLERAESAETDTRRALVDSKLLRAEQRHQTKTEGHRGDIIEIVNSTLQLSEDLESANQVRSKLRNDVAVAMSLIDVELIASGDEVIEMGHTDIVSRSHQNDFFVQRGEAPDQLFAVRRSGGEKMILATGFPIEDWRVHPFEPVAAVWDDVDLHLVDLTGETPDRIVANRATRRIQSVDWSECGSLLAIGSADHFTYVFQSDAMDQPAMVLTGAHSWVNHVRFTHDRLLMASCRGGGGLAFTIPRPDKKSSPFEGLEKRLMSRDALLTECSTVNQRDGRSSARIFTNNSVQQRRSTGQSGSR